MKVLLVEDEKKIASYIRKGLSESGFVVDVAYDGETGLRLAKSERYELIILDVMLPKCDGWTVLRELRKAKIDTLTLFLTARDSTEDRIRGWELGADGYLVKPFSFQELVANLRSLLKRSRIRQDDIIQVADLEIDLLQHRAIRAGNRLDLTIKEFNLLALLARRQGEALSRTYICEKIWNIAPAINSNMVDVHIRRLRAKVDDPFHDKLIHTVRGIGYVFRYDES
jgi:two-component system copper resistance phosphate regulon response regulator CusR